MKMKRILSAALVLAMLVGFLPGAGVTAEAAGGETTTNTITQEANSSAQMRISVTVPAKAAVSYIDADGTNKTTGTDYKNVRADEKNWTSGWYVVDKDVTITERITVTGAVHLILCDGATLTVNNSSDKGFEYETGTSLTIYGQTEGTGKLSATGGGPEGRAINAATLTINGGKVEANGSDGIYADYLTINGGDIIASGESHAIRANYNMIVKGGNVTATATGMYGAGIYAAGATLTVSGGNIIARGTGANSNGIYTSTGPFTVSGGTVTAQGISKAVDGDNISIDSGMTIVAGDSATTAQETAADQLSDKKWAYIEKSEPLTAVSYLDEKGASQTLNAAPTTYTRVKPYTVDWKDGWYVVDKDVTITGDVTVSGNAKLILTDGATLTVEKQLWCIGYGCSLAIYGQQSGTGTLRVKGDNVGMNLGQGNNVIYGGTLDVSGESMAISVNSMGQFTIAGGTVNAAASGDTGTGIYVYPSATLTIRGGAVTASGQGKAINVVNNPSMGFGTLNIAPNMAAKAGADEPNATFVTDFATNFGNYKWVCIGIFHHHNFTSYALSTTNATNDTITAVCGNADGKCTLGENLTATLTIAAQNDGTATLTGGADFGVSDADIVYYQQQNNEWTLIENNGKPSGDGFFKASITVGEGDNAKTAEVIYGVGKVTKDANFSAKTAHGDFTVPKAATIGATVSVTTTPAPGYQLANITATKAGGGSAENVRKDSENPNVGTFTMPSSAVTVSAEFEPRNVGVTLTVAEGAPETCTAALMTYDAANKTYTSAPVDFTSKVDEKFILSVTGDENYDYTIKFDGDMDAATKAMREFTDEEYRAYADYLEDNELEAPAQTDLYWVTMPAVANNKESMAISVEFAGINTYTILYKTASTDSVWCKFTDSRSASYVAKLENDLSVGGETVWSVTFKSAYVPLSVAFAATAEGAKAAETAACTVQQSADLSALTTDGNHVVIGGDARAVAAAFGYEGNDNMWHESYQLAIVKESNGIITAGSVTAPAAPSREGFTFMGWRGFQYDNNGMAFEKLYAEGDSVPVRENITLGAVWEPKQPTVTVNPNNGEASTNTKGAYDRLIVKPEDIERVGFALENWLVGKSVTESGKFFPAGSEFDFSTKITDDLELDAKWKHVHSYTSFKLSVFKDALPSIQKYNPYLHVDICGCADVDIVAHTFRNGVCTACGYTKDPPTQADLEVTYWKENGTNAWMSELPRTVKVGAEATISAIWQIGTYQFSKWQYRFSDNGKWEDLASDTTVGFIVPTCSKMMLRAIYVNTITQPQLSLSARNYVTQAQGWNWDTVLFQMDYKLPDGYTLVDAGVRMGDNAGISYYQKKEVKQSAGQKAAMAGLSFGMNLLPGGGGLSGFLSDQVSGAISDATSDPQYYYEKRENSVLQEMTAATLAEYMLKFKPVNVEKYPPIYWEAKAQTKSRTGSVNTITPLSFIQKNNGMHYIYGMAYLTYKDNTGAQRTIYTEAIPVTRDSVPDYTVKATPSGRTNTKPQ